MTIMHSGQIIKQWASPVAPSKQPRYSFEYPGTDQGPDVEMEGQEQMDNPLGDEDQNQMVYDDDNMEAVADYIPVSYEMTSEGKLSKRYVCQDCGKGFDKLNRYRLHITVHSNIKPFKCPKCDQRFRLPGILATHIKVSYLWE